LQNVHRMKAFIHQNKNWPNFTWDSKAFLNLLSEARNLQGRLLGKMETLGFDLKNEASLDTLNLDVIKSSEIEWEYLNLDQDRFSAIELKYFLLNFIFEFQYF
jgi:Fic family protein